MKVKVEIMDNVEETYAVIYTRQVDEEVQDILKVLENSSNKNFLTLIQGEKFVIVNPKDIYMVRLEDTKIKLYDYEKTYISNRRLYEVEEQLGKGFMKISKTTIVNLSHMESVEPSFQGTMYLHMKNGCKDYISRKYLPELKKYLGL